MVVGYLMTQPNPLATQSAMQTPFAHAADIAGHERIPFFFQYPIDSTISHRYNRITL